MTSRTTPMLALIRYRQHTVKLAWGAQGSWQATDTKDHLSSLVYAVYVYHGIQ